MALLVVALGVALLALVTAVSVHLRISGTQARYRILWADGEKDVIAVVSHQASNIAHLQSDVGEVRAELARMAGDVAQSLRHVAVVRYGASGDLGGRLSFSAAIVDDRGDGMVISSIHAPGEPRTCAKGVVQGVSEVALTPEEWQALAAARTGKGST